MAADTESQLRQEHALRGQEEGEPCEEVIAIDAAAVAQPQRRRWRLVAVGASGLFGAALVLAVLGLDVGPSATTTLASRALQAAPALAAAPAPSAKADRGVNLAANDTTSSLSNSFDDCSVAEEAECKDTDGCEWDDDASKCKAKQTGNGGGSGHAAPNASTTWQNPFCESHPNCRAAGLSGTCCPSHHGLFLGCCSQQSAYRYSRHDGYISSGGNIMIERGFRSVETAQSRCSEIPSCQGFTFDGHFTQWTDVYYKNKWNIYGPGSGWTSYKKEEMSHCWSFNDWPGGISGTDGAGHSYTVSRLGAGGVFKQASRDRTTIVGYYQTHYGPHTLKYSGGDSLWCGGFRRRGSVVIVEDHSLFSSPTISFYEPEVCVYEARISVPRLC